MSVLLATLLAATAAAVAQLLVPRRLRGRSSNETLPTAASPRTSTVQALVLLAEAIAWAILIAVAIAIPASLIGAVGAIDSPTVLLAVGSIATAMTVAVVVASAPARAEIRLERRLAQLSKAAAAGSLPPLPPSPEMQALIEPIACVNRDIAALERLGNGNAEPAELADLHKMRDGLVELFVEKDLARRIGMLRSAAPAPRPKRRPLSPIESLGAFLLRDRLIALFPAPATAALTLGVYVVSALAAAWLAGQPETALLAQRIASRAGEVVRVAEAHQASPQPDAGTRQPAALNSIRTANLNFSSFVVPSNVSLDVSPPTAVSRDAAAEQEIAVLTLKLEATEAMLERAEQALREAKAEQLRLMEEAERTRDVDVATVASDAQLERMAHEAALAVEEERLRQKEIELGERLAELEETKTALRREKQRLVAMIEDKRRQAQAFEARVRLERSAVANEARVAERQAIAEQTREAKRFELEDRRIEERQRALDRSNVATATEAPPAVTQTLTYVPASAPAADGSAELAETSEPARSSGTWQFAAIDPIESQSPDRAGIPDESATASAVATPPAGQGTIAEAPRAILTPISPLAALECGRVRAASALTAEANAGRPEPSKNRNARLNLETVRALLECGQALMTKGDLTAARLAFEKVAAAGIAKGALALGTTFDPHALAKAKLDGSEADTKLARFWYKRALILSGQ